MMVLLGINLVIGSIFAIIGKYVQCTSLKKHQSLRQCCVNFNQSTFENREKQLTNQKIKCDKLTDRSLLKSINHLLFFLWISQSTWIDYSYVDTRLTDNSVISM